MPSSDYTLAQTFKKGDRVELHPGLNAWMRGARFGEVSKVDLSGMLVHVRLDKQPKKRHLRLPKDRVRHA